MFGDILSAFVNAIRKAPFTKEYDLNVCLVRNDGRDIVNTTLPCVAVSMQDNPNPRIFIGGLIEDIVDIQLSVIANYDNMGLSPDNNHQIKMLNLPHKVRNYIEEIKQSKYFKSLIHDFEFFPLYDGFRTYQSVASMNAMEKIVFVCEIKYKCRIVDKRLHDKLNPSYTLNSVRVIDSTDNRDDRTSKS